MEKVEAWKGSDGKLYATEAEARRADEADALRSRIETFCSSYEGPPDHDRVGFEEWLFEHAEALRFTLAGDAEKIPSSSAPKGPLPFDAAPYAASAETVCGLATGQLPMDPKGEIIPRDIAAVLRGCIAILQARVDALGDATTNLTYGHEVADALGNLRQFINRLNRITDNAFYTPPEHMDERWREATVAFSAAVKQGVLPKPSADAPQWARDLSDLFEGRVGPKAAKAEPATQVLL